MTGGKMYNEKVMELFKNPKNVGIIEDADGEIKLQNQICGDAIEFYIKIRNEIIIEIKFRTFGCAAAIAASSIITEMLQSKTLEEAKKITSHDVIAELGGIPTIKRYCVDLVVEALSKLIEDQGKKTEKQILFAC
jgi:nitrogen fixation NifU-like protein